MKIIPTVLANDKRAFAALWKRVVPLSDTIQIDFMDGRFVATKSIPLDDAPDVRRLKKTFEAHLMVKEPMPWAAELIHRGYKRIVLHYESVWQEDLPLISRFMKRVKAECLLALNPETPVRKVVPYAKLFDGVLFLGVHPGKNGAPYVKKTPARIKEFRKHCPRVLVQVDGGMTPLTIREVARAGASRVNTGSYVGKAKDPKRALKEMYDAAR